MPAVPDVDHESDVLDLLDTGLVRIDSSGRILYLNSAAEQCLLVSRDRAHGRNLSELGVVPAELAKAAEEAALEGQGFRLHELKLGTGQFDCAIRRLENGHVLLELHSLEWEKKRMQLQQRELQTGMLELLSRNLGHEVRNPLGGIRGAAQMLAEELESVELSTLARLIMRESDRIDELIQSFGQPELSNTELDVYPIIDEALDLLLAEFRDLVRIERDYDPSIPTLQGDGSAIRRVVLNLLRNACQGGATVVKVRTRVEQGSSLLHSGPGSVVRLDVIDDGRGVSESLQPLLFLPFVTGRRDGTGLGLALSQQIAAAHGGLLTYEALDHGSCFSMFLPIQNGSGSIQVGEVH